MPSSTFTQILILGIGACLAALLVIVGMRRPWWVTVAAIAALPLVPSWVGVNVSIFFVNAHLALALLAIASILVSRPWAFRLHAVDLAVVAALVVLLGLALLHVASLSHAYALFQGLVAYTLGRVAAERFGLRRIFTVVAIAFGTAAVLLLVEAAAALNLWTTYVRVPNSQFAAWSSIQYRGGVARSEGAFGHSIAAGGSMAIAAVLALDSSLKPWLRLTGVAVMGAAILTTFSRIGMITAAIGITLALFAARTTLATRARTAVLCILGAGGAAFALGSASVFAESGAEAANSASYRVWILDLLTTLEPFGFASSYSRSTAGGSSFGNYESIDNAVLHFALSNGWVLTLVLLCLLAAALLPVARRTAGVAGVALVAQVPSLFMVALITQYSMVFWLCAGLAVAEVVSTNQREDLERSRRHPPVSLLDSASSGVPSLVSLSAAEPALTDVSTALTRGER